MKIENIFSMKLGVICLLCVTFLLSDIVEGFYFTIPPGQRMCFYEELSYETHPVFIHYNVPDLPGSGTVTFTVYDPLGNEKTGMASGKKEDTLSFTSFFVEGLTGAYAICASVPDATIAVQMYLAIDTVKPQDTDEGMAGRTLIDGYTNKMRHLNRQIETIMQEAEYFEARHNRFEMTSQSTYSRLVWWGFVHVALLLGSTVWQVLHLKSFFRQKKLV